MYKKVSHILEKAVHRFVEKEGLERKVDSIHLMRPPSHEMGDYASNVALMLADAARRPPREVAEAIIGHIDDHEGLLDETPTVAGKGFINLKVNTDNWLRMVQEVRGKGASFAHAPAMTQDRVLIEFVSANPTGPLHIGHGRGAVIGDALVNVLKAAGHDVASEYYVNDRGMQVNNLGLSVHFRYNRRFDADFPEPGGENWYRGQYVEDIAAKLEKEYGASLLSQSPDTPVFKDAGAREMLRTIREDLEALGISFDTWYHETQLGEDKMRQTVDDLIGRGFAWKNEDGSVAFRYEDDRGGKEKKEKKEGCEEEKERILVKKNGDFTYFAADIPYHLDKLGRGFDRMINIWGADHHGYVPRVKASLKAFGHDPSKLKVVLVQMVSLVRDGQPVKMSKRSGDFVTLRQIVDEVGRDALRFIFLTRRPDSQFEFDIEGAKRKNMDNPVFYVQYGHARLCSILRKAKERHHVKLDSYSDDEVFRLLREKLTLEEELSTLKDALRLREVVGDAARTLQPHRIATFAMDISKSLQSYYTMRWRVHKDPVLPPASAIAAGQRLPEKWDEEKMLARLLWIDSIRIAMKAALDILGVSAPERMKKVEVEDE